MLSHENHWKYWNVLVEGQCEQALVSNGLNHVHVIATINSNHGFSIMEYSQYIHIS